MQIRWVRYIPALVVNLCLMPPSWLGSKKLLANIWNWSLLLITFSTNLPVVLSSMIGWKELGVLYNVLFGLGMTTVLADLKWEGQYSKLIQALAMCTSLSRHVLYEIRDLRCFYEIWSRPGVEDDKHLAITSLNSWLENRDHSITFAWESLLRNLVLIYFLPNCKICVEHSTGLGEYFIDSFHTRWIQWLVEIFS